jgi:hypothetical protein
MRQWQRGRISIYRNEIDDREGRRPLAPGLKSVRGWSEALAASRSSGGAYVGGMMRTRSGPAGGLTSIRGNSMPSDPHRRRAISNAATAVR